MRCEKLGHSKIELDVGSYDLCCQTLDLKT